MKARYFYVHIILVSAFYFSLAGCQTKASDSNTIKGVNSKTDTSVVKDEAATATSLNDAAAILKIKEVPILCYHQIRDWRPKDSKTAKDYIIPPASFKEHIKMLADSGYHTILPDQLYDYLTKGAALPSKPIMLTFDDTDLDNHTIHIFVPF